MEATMFQDSLIESGGRFEPKRGPLAKAFNALAKLIIALVVVYLAYVLVISVPSSTLQGVLLTVYAIAGVPVLYGIYSLDLRWTSIFSFFLQAFLIGIMILIPLIYTEALPKSMQLTILASPPPPPPPAPPAAPVQVVKIVQTDIENGQLRTPSKIPQKVAMIKEEEAPPPVSAMGGVVGGVPGGVPGGQMGGVLGGILSSTPSSAPKFTAPQRVRVSQGVSEGNLINRITPPYPPMAKMARVQGAVVLQAIISKNGAIENLRVVSGHPMLVQAALDAVRQWRYRPYLLNGEPVEVETQITLNFSLSGG